MPELPEVEAARALIAGNCEGKKILRAIIGEDTKVMPDPAKELQESLEGKTIHRALRKGKHLWLDLGPEHKAILFHFGMTGGMVVKGVKAVQYRNFVVGDEEWPPRFWKIQLEMEGGCQAAFYDGRRFGKVRLVQDPENNEPISKLGFDCLLGRPPLEDFAGMLAKKNKGIKALLLDQAFCAGVGNWVADEILYQARIHPEQKASSLSEEQVAALHDKLHAVVALACEAGADDSRYPPTWLFHTKWKKAGKAGEEPVRLEGNLVRYEDMAGRVRLNHRWYLMSDPESTAWVPAVQKLPEGPTKGKGKGRGGGKDVPATAVEGEGKAPKKGGRKRKAASPAASEGEGEPEDGEEEEEQEAPAKKPKRTRAKAAASSEALPAGVGGKKKPAGRRGKKA